MSTVTVQAPPLTPQLRERMVAGCLQEAGGRSVAELERRRDEFLAELLALVDRFALAPDPRPSGDVLLTVPGGCPYTPPTIT